MVNFILLLYFNLKLKSNFEDFFTGTYSTPNCYQTGSNSFSSHTFIEGCFFNYISTTGYGGVINHQSSGFYVVIELTVFSNVFSNGGNGGAFYIVFTTGGSLVYQKIVQIIVQHLVVITISLVIIKLILIIMYYFH